MELELHPSRCNLLVQFMKPLDASARNGRELISIADVRKVFSNVEMITNVNSILLEGLESRLSRWTCVLQALLRGRVDET